MGKQAAPAQRGAPDLGHVRSPCRDL
jgi:hypothetical protein